MYSVVLCFRKKLRNLLQSFLFILSVAPALLSAQISEPAKSGKGTIQRKVLIFDFENQTGKAELGYLAGSIADALVDPVKKTKKFQLLSRDNAKVEGENAAPPAAKPAQVSDIPKNQPIGEKSQTDKTPTTTLSKFNRDEAIRVGREVGADVVVFGKFSELNGVLLLSAQAYETDTKLLKVAEEVLTKSDASMFTGINQLAEKIAISMERELPMFDAAEAELRRAEAMRKIAEARQWEIQLFSGYPYLHGMYSTDGTVTYDKGFPVHKLRGYSLGFAVWESGLAKNIFFMPKGSRFGIQGKATIASGFADIVGANSQVLSSNTKITGQFFSGYLMLGIPYLDLGRFMMFAEVGGGAMYGKVTTPSDTIFATTMPGAVLGTSAAYHWPYWSLGLSYKAQAWFLSSTTAFLQHDIYLYAGLRL